MANAWQLHSARNMMRIVRRLMAKVQTLQWTMLTLHCGHDAAVMHCQLQSGSLTLMTRLLH